MYPYMNSLDITIRVLGQRFCEEKEYDFYSNEEIAHFLQVCNRLFGLNNKSFQLNKIFPSCTH